VLAKLELPLPQAVTAPCLPPAHFVRQIPALLEVSCQHLVPPLHVRDVVGLMVLTIADVVLGTNYPTGSFDADNILVRQQHALQLVQAAHPGMAWRAGFGRNEHVLLTSSTSACIAWEGFLTWLKQSLVPALEEAEANRWRPNPATRNGQLATQWCSGCRGTRLPFDGKQIARAVLEEYYGTGRRKTAGDQPEISAAGLRWLIQLSLCHGAVLYRSDDGYLRLGDDRVRDARLRCFRERRDDRRAREPVSETDLLAMPGYLGRRPSSELSARSFGWVASQAYGPDELAAAQEIWELAEAAAADDLDRQDLALVREGNAPSRRQRAARLGVDEKALRRREDRLLECVKRHVPDAAEALRKVLVA
jgi:hypothetical protein